ncbi:hypothetical protein SRAA_0028 [Serpentinimonas raichei]|uniref:Uncharacterized protein n=1 Tax=Serpentinimonas raichei TaxID=1458425 RepID=A0A060NGA0_9BURK|nr:hypothetical protein SRAA_0028 [Serpentinimonas raichei]
MCLLGVVCGLWAGMAFIHLTQTPVTIVTIVTRRARLGQWVAVLPKRAHTRLQPSAQTGRGTVTAHLPRLTP